MARDSKSVRYVGPHAAVEVFDPETETRHFVERDSEVELRAELADALLTQEANWASARSKRSAADVEAEVAEEAG